MRSQVRAGRRPHQAHDLGRHRRRARADHDAPAHARRDGRRDLDRPRVGTQGDRARRARRRHRRGRGARPRLRRARLRAHAGGRRPDGGARGGARADARRHARRRLLRRARGAGRGCRSARSARAIDTCSRTATRSRRGSTCCSAATCRRSGPSRAPPPSSASSSTWRPAGLDAAGAIRAATSRPAAWLGAGDELGALRPGLRGRPHRDARGSRPRGARPARHRLRDEGAASIVRDDARPGIVARASS